MPCQKNVLHPKVGHPTELVQFFMAKPKYSLGTRLAVVSHYPPVRTGCSAPQNVLALKERQYVARSEPDRYTDGITWKNGRHSHAFRIAVVHTALAEELSMREAAAQFNISTKSVVRHWVNVYKDAGEKGLLSIKPGRSKDMTKPKKTPPLTDAALEKLSPEELRAELRYMRAENACLKKLKALVQREKNGEKPE